jgi:hypothetical protein
MRSSIATTEGRSKKFWCRVAGGDSGDDGDGRGFKRRLDAMDEFALTVRVGFMLDISPAMARMIYAGVFERFCQRQGLRDASHYFSVYFSLESKKPRRASAGRGFSLTTIN